MGEIKYPIEVSDIEIDEHFQPVEQPLTAKTGDWVAVRPCAEKYGDKTHLGVMLGDMIQMPMARHNPETKVLSLMAIHNPAMWVPALKTVIWGSGSWWRVIDSPDDIRDVTDDDINGTPYMRALGAEVEREIRSEVRAMARAMEDVLRDNDHKTGWKDDSVDSLIEHLVEESRELVEAHAAGSTPDKVAKEAIDVANMAMMVVDSLGCLK